MSINSFKLAISFFIPFLTLNVSGQVTIKGTVSSSDKTPISNAIISVVSLRTDDILAYTKTDKNGKFELSFSSDESQILLTIRSFGFEPLEKVIPNTSLSETFTLFKQANELEEVVVKLKPIVKKGDTINYNVQSFAKEHDRTISDVMKRMPGIEVRPNGEILYQGKPINKYYIEGLDLLEGKYALANENLPHKDVAKVQILENHQPKKILDSLTFSTEAAVNIKLKKAITTTGQAEIGGGFAPTLWDVNATPMFFAKKIQALLSYQTNNIGDDVSQQNQTLSTEDVNEEKNHASGRRQWVMVQPIPTPSFSEKRWLNNNVHLASIHVLKTLPKDYSLKVYASYLNDFQQMNGGSMTKFFTPSGEIILQEQANNKLYFNSLDTSISLLKNTKKTYLKNRFSFYGNWDSQLGAILQNNTPVTQYAQNPFLKLYNRLSSLFFVGKQLVEFTSELAYGQAPQNLSVRPGQFIDLLNNGSSYDQLTQEIFLKNFHVFHSIGMKRGWKEFTFTPTIQHSLQKNNFASEIIHTGSSTLPIDFTNDLDWLSSKTSVAINTQFKKNKWKLELLLPLNWNFIQLEDKPLQASETVNRTTFEPYFSVLYALNSKLNVQSTAIINNRFGQLGSVHYGYFLTSYRNIQRIHSPLPQSFAQNYNFTLSYRNPVRSFFWNVNFNYLSQENNLLFENQVFPNGANEIKAIEKTNSITYQSLSAQMSKYISEIKSNFSLFGNLSTQRYFQILNSSFSEIKIHRWSTGAKANIDFYSWWNMEYDANFHFSNNWVENLKNPTIQQQTHIISNNFFPAKNSLISLRMEYQKNELIAADNENFFIDLLYRFSWKKRKLDFELHFNNVFNTNSFRTVLVENFQYLETNFTLRPRQILFIMRFSF